MENLTGPETLTNETTAQFFFDCSKEDCSFACELRDGAGALLSSSNDCETGLEFTGLADDTYTFTVTATDLLGTTGPAASLSWTVVTVGPTTELLQTPGQISGTTQATFDFDCSKENCTFVCALSGPVALAAQDCTAPFTYSNLADGAYIFTIFATDSLGNQGPETTFAFSMTTAPPTVSLTATPPSLSLPAPIPPSSFSAPRPSATSNAPSRARKTTALSLAPHR